MVDFSQSNYSVDESASAATIGVKLNCQPGENPGSVSVSYASSDGTATAGSSGSLGDYAVNGTLTWGSSGDCGVTKTFDVPIQEDSILEDDETVNLSLSNGNTAVLTILDNELRTFDFSQSTYSVDEGGNYATIGVTLSCKAGVDSNSAEVSYESSDGTATAGSSGDYSAVSGTLTWGASGDCDVTKTFDVLISEDAEVEGNETVKLSLSNPSEGSLDPASDVAVLTIIDNDTLPAPDNDNFADAIELTCIPSGDMGSNVGATGETGEPAQQGTINSVWWYWTAPSDAYVIVDTCNSDFDTYLSVFTGSAVDSLTLVGSNDDSSCGLQSSVIFTTVAGTTYSFAVDGYSSYTGNININLQLVPLVDFSQLSYSVDESASAATIGVKLNCQPGEESNSASVSYATSDGTATAGSSGSLGDYSAVSGTLTWGASGDCGVTKTFDVPIQEDSEVEGDETVNLNLSNGVTTVLTILDNDSRTFDFSQSTYSVDEGGSHATIGVTLNYEAGVDSSSASVSYESSDGTATAGSSGSPGDYSAVSGTFTWGASGDCGITKTFYVPIHEDSEMEGNETVNLSLSNPFAGSIDLGSATLTITNNDSGDIVKNDVIIDFGSGTGIWARMNNSYWANIHDLSVISMAIGDMDGNNKDDVIFDFGSQYGLWVLMNNTSWADLHSLSADSMVTGDLDGGGQDDVIIDFGAGIGIYVRMNNSTWVKLHSLSSDSIVTGDVDGNGKDDVIIDFGAGIGIYVRMDNSTWVKLHSLSSDSIVTGDVDGNGKDDVIIDFGASYGIYVRMNNSAWVPLHSLSPKSMVTGDIDNNGKDDVIIDFGAGIGIYVRMNNSGWVKLHDLSAKQMVTGNIDGLLSAVQSARDMIQRLPFGSETSAARLPQAEKTLLLPHFGAQ